MILEETKTKFGKGCDTWWSIRPNFFISLSIDDKKIINGHHTEDEVFDEPDNSPTIENAIQEKDFDKLVKYVLEGDSERLAERSSEDEEMQEFIKNIPAFQVFTKCLVHLYGLDDFVNG